MLLLQPLYETYHGVYVNVLYLIVVDCDRGVLKKGLHREIEFIVEVPVSQSETRQAGRSWAVWRHAAVVLGQAGRQDDTSRALQPSPLLPCRTCCMHA